MNPLVKLVIAVLLLLCLADMPYGFYQLVRFAATAAFAYLSYEYFKAKREGMGVLFAALALLFQPFFKVALGRTIWNAVDIIVAILLFYFIIQSFQKIQINKNRFWLIKSSD
jgi:uncharacterized protein YacL